LQGEQTMRFYEFAPQPNRPVLKISQQAQPQTATSAYTTPPAFPSNTASTSQTTEPIRAYPRAYQHERIQNKLATDIAKSAQTVAPTEDDIVIANIRYAEAQRAADDAYERTHNVERVNRRWKRRD
jgi:hypothetical protein